MQLRPTGRCFDDALDFIQLVCVPYIRGPIDSVEDILRYVPSDVVTPLTLVHGVCTVPIGEPYAHAWVEESPNLIWQGGMLNGRRVFYAVDLNEFYERMGVLRSERYSCEQAYRANWEANHYGPWVADLMELCRTPGRRAANLSGVATLPLQPKLIIQPRSF